MTNQFFFEKQLIKQFLHKYVASIPVNGLLGNWVRLDCRIAVSNRSYDRLKIVFGKLARNRGKAAKNVLYRFARKSQNKPHSVFNLQMLSMQGA